MKKLKNLKMFILAVGLACGVHVFSASAMESKNTNNTEYYDYIKNREKFQQLEIEIEKQEPKFKLEENKLKTKLKELEIQFPKSESDYFKARDDFFKLKNELFEKFEKGDLPIESIKNNQLFIQKRNEFLKERKKINDYWDKKKKLEYEFMKENKDIIKKKKELEKFYEQENHLAQEELNTCEHVTTVFIDDEIECEYMVFNDDVNDFEKDEIQEIVSSIKNMINFVKSESESKKSNPKKANRFLNSAKK